MTHEQDNIRRAQVVIARELVRLALLKTTYLQASPSLQAIVAHLTQAQGGLDALVSEDDR